MSTRIAAVALGVLGALHTAWGLGAAWPFGSRATLADAVVGRDDVPPAAACWAVAGALGAAAMVVAGRPSRLPQLRRVGASGVTVVLVGRGLLGLAGKTDVVSSGSTSPRFRELDRRVYSPLCLALAVLALPATRRRRDRRCGSRPL